MKRTAIILSILAVLLLIAIPGSLFFLGSSIQSYSEEAIAEANSYLSPAIGELTLPVYNKGLMSSEVISRLDLVAEEEDASLAMNHTIYHSSVAFTPHGVKPRDACIITTMNREAFPEELVEGINEIYGEEEPFVITSLIDYSGGGQDIGTNITEVDYKEGILSFQFDGGEGQFQMNSSGVTSGGLDLTAFSLRNDSEDDPDNFIVLLKESNFTIDSTSDNTVTTKGVMGGLEWRFANEDDGNPFTISMGELTMELSQTPASDGSALMLGSSSVFVPHIKFRSGEEFDISINELAVTSEATSSGGMMTAEIIYSAGDVTFDMPIPEDFKLYSDMAGEGAEMSFQATLPISLMEDLIELQQRANKAQISVMNGDLSPEFEKELADTMESAMKSISKETNLGFGLRLGGGETETSVSADISYMGSKPMMEQMMPLLAIGSIVQNGPSLSMDSELKDGVLKTNGEVNPMLEQIAPMLMGEILWEDLMQGMQSGLTE